MQKTENKEYSRDVCLILAASFFFMASPMLVTPLIVGFSRSLGINGFITGIIGGLMNFCSLFCRPLFGRLGDTSAKERLASFGTLTILISTLGYAAAPNTAVVLISRILNGVGYSCCSLVLSLWMADILPADRIGEGMGLYGTMNALAMSVSPAIGIAIYKRLGYRFAFLLAALFALASFVLVRSVNNKGEPSVAEDRTKEDAKLTIIEPKVLSIALIIMLFTIPYCATQSFLVSYTEVKGVNVHISLFFPIYAAVLILLRFTLRDKFDKWPFRRFFWVSCFSAIGAMVSLRALNSNLVMLCAAIFLAGSYGIMCSVCQSTAVSLADPGKRGTANSTYYVGIDLGMTLGPFLGGILFDAVPVEFFYPSLAFCIPLSIYVYAIWQSKGHDKTISSNRVYQNFPKLGQEGERV